MQGKDGVDRAGGQASVRGAERRRVQGPAQDREYLVPVRGAEREVDVQSDFVLADEDRDGQFSSSAVPSPLPVEEHEGGVAPDLFRSAAEQFGKTRMGREVNGDGEGDSVACIGQTRPTRLA